MKNFREILDSDGVFVFDGAVGTRFYDKGIYINRSYDELNLTGPTLCAKFTPNTSKRARTSSKPIRSARRGINFSNTVSKISCEKSISPARNLAREAAGEDVFVAGAIGPLDLRIEPYGPTSFEEAKEMFAEQIAALLEGDVDLFVLETFSGFVGNSSRRSKPSENFAICRSSRR